MPIAKTLNHDFFKTWTPEMAYVLGYFSADGSMLRNNRGAHYIEFTSTDLCLLEKIRTVVDSSHHISIRPQREAHWKRQYRLQIGSKSWFNDLRLLGFTQDKSNSMEFPRVPESLMGPFVRGYFDGDGCVYLVEPGPRVKGIMQTLFTSGSLLFLRTLWSHLRNIGIQGGSLRKKTRGYELLFSRRDSLALWRLMYDTASVPLLSLPRKREKLERAIRVLGLVVRS